MSRAAGFSEGERLSDERGCSDGAGLQPSRRGLDSAWAASAWYLLLTLVLTWPLLPRLARALPADLGDPVLNAWILRWDADHLLRLASGHLDALRGFWSPGIFYPAPLALAYSEHLVAQALQILPVYALTGNVVLCYNLLFLSTFVLSALGVYLLVRSLTGNGRAAFVAGLLFAFVPYRIAQFPHVQVLSTQWMAFTLYGLHRFFETRRARALAGASLALVAQNLSCGYFLLFFAPFAGAFAAWEAVRRGLLRDWRLLAHLGLAAAAVALATWPFLQPYLELRTLGFNARTLDEARLFSGNVLAYLTTTPSIRGWGRFFMVFRAPEGELFPGFILLAVLAWGAWYERGGARVPWWRTVLAVVLGAWAAAQLLVVLYLLTGGGPRLDVGFTRLSLKDFGRTVWLALAAVAAFAASCPRARRAVGRLASQGWAFWTCSALTAFVLSLGPAVRAGVKEVGPGPYVLLHRFVPGFDGLRVPARFGLVVALMLAVLAGLALDRLLRAEQRSGPAPQERGGMTRRAATLLVCALCVLFLAEARPAPIRLDGASHEAGLRAPVGLKQGADVPAVYRYLRTLPGREPVLEFPFGFGGYEVQYVYYSADHGHPIVNGYSGVFPPAYYAQCEAFGHGVAWKRPWEALVASGARLVVLHEGAYLDPRQGRRLRAWLLAGGAQMVATFGSDSVFRMPLGTRPS